MKLRAHLKRGNRRCSVLGAGGWGGDSALSRADGSLIHNCVLLIFPCSFFNPNGGAQFALLITVDLCVHDVLF